MRVIATVKATGKSVEKNGDRNKQRKYKKENDDHEHGETG